MTSMATDESSILVSYPYSGDSGDETGKGGGL